MFKAFLPSLSHRYKQSNSKLLTPIITYIPGAYQPTSSSTAIQAINISFFVFMNVKTAAARRLVINLMSMSSDSNDFTSSG